MAAPRSASKGVPSGAPGALLQSDLRKQLGGTTRELQAAWAHIQDLEERCRQAEADKVRAEIYSRRLEEKLERSGKGVALLRAAKLTSEVEALARENERLRGAIEGRDEEVAHMQRVLQQVAPGTGFDGAAALSEYYHLKALAPRLQHDLELKDARLQQLGAELAALRPLKATAAQLTARVADLEKQLAGSEEDKDALLEYVSELQETQAALDATAREAVSSCEMATQELESLRGELAAAAKINDELVASAAEARCAAEAVQADATEAPELRRQLADYQERFEEARRELVNVEAHVLHLGTEVAVLRSEKAQAQSLVGETMAQFKAAQAAATQAAAELSAARAELTAQASQSEAKARALGTENELLAAESCTAAELLQKTTGEAAQLRQALADASCALETERVEHHRQVLGLEQRVAELADELATAQEALAARAEQLAAAHAEVGQVRAHERDAARLAVAQHRTALEASVADNKELRASLAEAQVRNRTARPSGSMT